jgi:hypothetical protein
MTGRASSLLHRYLDPASSLGEILFGLIMTLTFTLGAGVIIEDEGREGVRQLLIAVIGCNLAWGIIDGALYMVSELFDRGRKRRLGHSLRTAPDETTAIGLVASELDDLLEDVTSPGDREALYRRVADNIRGKPPAPNALQKDDVLGALTSFCLVVLTSVPAAAPFLFIDQLHTALRVSNAFMLGLLFMTGYWWARYTVSSPWLVGFSFLFGGIVLVLVAIALGG